MKTFWITITLAFGLLVGPAEAGNSFCTTATGHETCNDTDLDLEVRMCHTHSVALTKSLEAGVSGGGFVAKAGLAETATVTQTGCVSATLPPGKCVYFEYKVECHSYEVPHFVIFTKVEVECQTVGVTVKCKKLRSGDG